MKLHHSGFIVQNINQWEKNMLFEKKLADVVDPLQNARLSLYTNFSNSYIELIQPLSKEAYTWNSLEKNGEHFNHFCYEVENEKELNEIVSKTRMIKVLGPIPALLFENRNIYFYYNRNKQIVEFVLNQA